MNRPHLRNQDGNYADALILRRYIANWEIPDDRKVNPWDINEPDPTDAYMERWELSQVLYLNAASEIR